MMTRLRYRTVILGATTISFWASVAFFRSSEAKDVAGSFPEHSGRTLRDDVTVSVQSLIRNRRMTSTLEGFTEQEKQEILNFHNAQRSMVQPTAANMIELKWSTEIEAFAQFYSTACVFHIRRPDRNLGEWTNMGETPYNDQGDVSLGNLSSNFWWQQGQNYNLTSNSCQTGQTCDDYFDVAWARSEYIGCGASPCTRHDGTDFFVVCNYSGSVVRGTRPYEEGPSCSNCPVLYPSCRNNLCVCEDLVYNCQPPPSTEPSTQATAPDNQTTDPSTQATSPDNQNTDASTQTTTPDNQATDPSTQKTSPDSQNTEPSTQFISPNTQNTSWEIENTTNDPDNFANPLIFSYISLILCISLQIFKPL